MIPPWDQLTLSGGDWRLGVGDSLKTFNAEFPFLSALPVWPPEL